MKTPFDMIDHTADVGVVAYGADARELFSNAARALFSLIAEPESVEGQLRLDLHVSSGDRESLLVDWLNELIYVFDVRHILFNRFDIQNLTDSSLEAACYGEPFDPVRHRLKTGVKAATYHMLKLDRCDDRYRAQIIFDI